MPTVKFDLQEAGMAPMKEGKMIAIGSPAQQEAWSIVDAKDPFVPPLHYGFLECILHFNSRSRLGTALRKRARDLETWVRLCAWHHLRHSNLHHIICGTQNSKGKAWATGKSSTGAKVAVW